MGLDMYLYAEKYESKYRNKTLSYPKELEELSKLINTYSVASKTTTYKIGCWRKFNALHNYIINHFANGRDEYQRVYLLEEEIKEILNILKKVEESFKTAKIKEEKDGYIIYENPIAEKLLPTKDGFFFGSLDYDDFYLDYVKRSIKIFEEVLKLLEERPEEGYDIYYQASW